MPGISRRSLLTAAVLGPLGVAARELVEGTARGAALAAPLLRRPGAGSSAARCARCGAGDHAMLDPRCPSATTVHRGPR